MGVYTDDLPQTLCVDVTPADIANGGDDETICPIAQAICRKLGLDPWDGYVEVPAPVKDAQICIGTDNWNKVALYRHTLQTAAFTRLWDSGGDIRGLVQPVRICLERVA